ncbi:MAG: ROK family protein [Thermoflavifilum sp.]|nr:ROK family protein [Thermoflavifilum sp.]
MKQPLAVGIDIGGTNTNFGIVDRRGNLLFSGRIPTRQHTEISFFIQELHAQLYPLIQQAVADGAEVKGIGVGVPNGNYFRGTIEFAPNLPWRGVVPLASLIQEAFILPTVLTNDANAAAIGEMTYGAARGMKDFIVITLGTGLGSGIVVNGQLVYGHDGFAGELGHVIVFPQGRLCGCGRRGCLETYVSATGIVRTMRELLHSQHTYSSLREVDPAAITAKMIADAVLQGDELAKQAFEFTGKILGQQLANFVAFSSPEAIILFGGLTQAGDLIFRPTIHYMENNLLEIYRNKIKVLPSELKESDAAILGASALVWEIKN